MLLPIIKFNFSVEIDVNQIITNLFHQRAMKKKLSHWSHIPGIKFIFQYADSNIRF